MAAMIGMMQIRVAWGDDEGVLYFISLSILYVNECMEWMAGNG